MSIKNTAVDLTTMHMQVSNTKNKIGAIVSLILSIIFLIVGLISFIFSWKVALVLLGISLVFFGISKFAKFATKVNENTINKLQNMKEPSSNERI
ncbi:MAG: hypothetical protein ABIA78_01245 [archaeon]